MDAGTNLEFDTPANLCADPKSTFSSMVSETGKQMAEHLRAAAAAGQNYDALSVEAKDLRAKQLHKEAWAKGVDLSKLAVVSGLQLDGRCFRSKKVNEVFTAADEIRMAIKHHGSSEWDEELRAAHLDTTHWKANLMGIVDSLSSLIQTSFAAEEDASLMEIVREDLTIRTGKKDVSRSASGRALDGAASDSDGTATRYRAAAFSDKTPPRDAPREMYEI